MGLINKESIFDLVPGSDPVINMNGLQGPSFDLGPSSTFQIDSLQIVPQTIIYQDLDGLPGPSFDNGPEPGGPNLIDTLHEQSLQNGYSYQYGNTTANIAATTLGLGGGQGAQFDNGPEPNTIVSTMDTIHENSLENLYESLVNPGASYGAGQVGATWPAINPSSLDLGGAPGTQFDNGPEPQGNDIDTLQESALVEMYNSAVNPAASYGAGQPNGAWPNVNSSNLSLNGAPGTQFAQQSEPTSGENQIDTIQEVGLEGLYNSAVNPQSSYGAGQPTGAWPVVAPSTLDLNGNSGPQFDNGPEPNVTPNAIDSFHESALVEMYNSAVNPGSNYGAGQPGSTYPNINATTLDMNGQVGPNFIPTFDVHQSLLTNTYQSTINPNSSYGAGQPGGAWPNISAGGLDINGLLPNNGQYINNLPE